MFIKSFFPEIMTGTSFFGPILSNWLCSLNEDKRSCNREYGKRLSRTFIPVGVRKISGFSGDAIIGGRARPGQVQDRFHPGPQNLRCVPEIVPDLCFLSLKDGSRICRLVSR
jgi:hypothetical protein